MADVIKSIGSGKDYASVTAWEAASYGATASDHAYGELYGTVTEASVLSLNDATPLSMTLRPASGENHDGTKGTGATIKLPAFLNPFYINANIPQTVEDIEIDFQGGNVGQGVQCQFNTKTVQRCLIYGISSSRGVAGAPLRVGANFTTTNFNNNVIFDCSFSGAFTHAGIRNTYTTSTTCNWYNNTVYNIDASNASGNVNGIEIVDQNSDTVKNNLTYDITASGGGTAADYNTVAGSYSNATTATNFSEDSTSPDGASYRSVTAVFTDAANGDFNLEAGSDTVLKESATDLGSTANVDASGRDRDAEGDDWSGGALQFVASSTTAPPTTAGPTTSGSTTPAPTTIPPTTVPPTTAPPTTLAPTTIITTQAPTTIPPTTLAPTTIITTLAPTTPEPTLAPTTIAPTTLAPTLPPTTLSPTTLPPTLPPTTLGPTTAPIPPVVTRRGRSNMGFSMREQWR